MGIGRREFVQGGTLAVATTLTFTGCATNSVKSNSAAESDPSGAQSVRDIRVLANIKETPNEDSLVNMQRDLVKAMAKPIEQRRWGMLIDTRKCVGCHACTVGCISENKLSPGVVYRPVIVKESGTYPNVRIDSTPRPCMQCSKPSCVPVCPADATWKRPDGVVAIDYDKCIGCHECLKACPYGARSSGTKATYYDGTATGTGDQKTRTVVGADSIEQSRSNEYGKEWPRKNEGLLAGIARKCHFCLHRLEVGQLPVCVATCIGRATYFGDLNDSGSLIASKIKSNSTYKLLPGSGTKPNVYYIGNKS